MDGSETAPWWFGAIFIATGAAIMGIGVGWIEVDPSSVHAPYWVLTACGGVFVLGGVMTWTSRLDERVNHLLALILVGMFASIASWIAFGPGEREFSGGASTGPISVGGSGGETLGRVMFGFGAVMLWLIEVVIAVKLIGSLRD